MHDRPPDGNAARTRRASARPLVLRRAALVAVGVAAALCLAGIFQHGLWTPDEPREAEIGREMLLSRWSAVPTLGGTPFLEKPPFFVWVMAAAYQAFGVSAGVARLPGALLSVGAAWFAYLMARRAGGRLAGVAAAVVLVTMSEFAGWSHRSVNDTALTFFVAAGHWTFLVARDDHLAGRRPLAYAAGGVCAGLAFLTKGPIGPVLVAGPPLLAAAAMRDWPFVRQALPRAALWCTAFVVALGLPWAVALADDLGRHAVKECLWDNTIGRATGGTTEEVGFLTHTNPPWYYLTGWPQSLVPWTLAIPALFFGGTLSRSWRAGRARYLALLALAGVVLLSIPAGKRPLYLIPLFPATAAVFGTWLSRAGSRRGGRFDRPTAVAIMALLALAAVAATWVTAGGWLPSGKTAEKLAAFVAYHGDAMPATAAACAVFAAAFGVLAFLAARRPAAWAARSAVVATAAGFLVVHLAGRPLMDRPLNDMEEGAKALAAAVPDDEEMLAVAPDETTRAVVPFYTGRMLRPIYPPRAAPGRPVQVSMPDDFGKAPRRYLVVMDSSEQFVGANTRARLRLVKTVTLNPDRPVNVYRCDAP
jgi:4-amino-4-deoxy-L-arabinose transferase-like glycosyltransferase